MEQDVQNAIKWIGEEMNNSKKYFNLASQYLTSSKLLLKTIIENDNCSTGSGINSSDNDILLDLVKNIKKSDASLLIPALFLGYQSIELYIKGLLINKNEEIEKDHEVSKFYEKLKKCYGEDSYRYIDIKNFYSNQIEIIKMFKKNNEITTIKDLYEAFRYPEITSGDIDHSSLRFNGQQIITQLKKLFKQLDKIEQDILSE